MTTTTVYSDTSDGLVYGESTTYLTARSGGGTVTAATADTTNRVCGQEKLGSTYYCYEAFYRFDTSAIADTDTIDSAVLSLYGDGDGSTTDFTLEARAKAWGPTLTTADYVAGASLGSDTLLATFATSGGFLAAYNAFTSDAAFVSNVSKTGFTELYVSSSLMRAGTAPTTAEYVDAFYGDRAGTTQDPKLVVTHSLPPKTVAVGLNTETDAAQTLTRQKRRATGLGAESDSALGLSHTKQKAAGLVTETDAAQGVTARAALSFPTETDAAQPVTPGKALATGLPLESDAAQPMSHARQATAGLVTETDAAQALASAKQTAVGLPLETDVAQTLAHAKRGEIGLVTETDSPLSVQAQKQRQLGLVTATDMALGVSHARRAVIGLVTEIDTALAIAALRVWRFFMPPTVRVYASKVQQERAGIKTPAMRRHFADFMRGGSDETDGGYTIGGRFYRGGVWNGPLSAAEVAALQAAGYAARIVAVTNPDDPKALPAALDV